MNGDIEKVVSEHSVQLGYLVGTMGDIKATLREISDTQRKMEVLMERQANHEEATKASFERFHTRMDKHEEEEKERVQVDKLYCNLVEKKAENGDAAFKMLKWIGMGFAILIIGSLYDLFIYGVK